MSLTPTTLGARLRQARVNVGLTQEEAAAAVGLPRISLLQIESGSRNVTSIELFQLARLYKIDPARLLAEEDAEDSPLVALCRAHASFAEDPQLVREIERHLDIFREGIELAALLGDRIQMIAPAYDLPDPRNYAEAIKQGEAMASQERKRLGLGNGPIPDVAEVISGQGIWASSSALPEDLSGLFMHHPSIGMAVIVNRAHPSRARRRFSYAHEYAHALADRRRTAAIITSRDNASELVEKRANAFAGEFLIPAAGVKEVLTRFDKGGASREVMSLWDAATGQGETVEKRNKPGSQTVGYQDVVYLAHGFVVSYETAVYRLSDMGAISREGAKELLASRDQAQRLAEVLKLFNPDAREIEQPLLTKQIGLKVLEAFRRGMISGERLLEVCQKLDIGPKDAQEFLVLAEQVR